MTKSIRVVFTLASILAAAAAQAETWPSRLIWRDDPISARAAPPTWCRGCVRPAFGRTRPAHRGREPRRRRRHARHRPWRKAEPRRLQHSGAVLGADHCACHLPEPRLRRLPATSPSVLMIGFSANVMIVPNSRPWKTIQDFIADARAKPGSISVRLGRHRQRGAYQCRRNSASPPGSRRTHVPYRGGLEVIADIMGEPDRPRISVRSRHCAAADPGGPGRGALVVSTPTTRRRFA